MKIITATNQHQKTFASQEVPNNGARASFDGGNKSFVNRHGNEDCTVEITRVTTDNQDPKPKEPIDIPVVLRGPKPDLVSSPYQVCLLFLYISTTVQP